MASQTERTELLLLVLLFLKHSDSVFGRLLWARELLGIKIENWDNPWCLQPSLLAHSDLSASLLPFNCGKMEDTKTARKAGVLLRAGT